MAAGEHSVVAGAYGKDIIRESSSPEPFVRPQGLRLARSARLPRRWSWRFRMPSQHPMTLRSHTRGIAAAAPSPSGSLLAGVQPPSRSTTVQTPRENEAGRVQGNPVTPARPAGGAWFHDLSERQNVEVFEDTEDQETLEALTPVLHSGSSENKENHANNLNVLESEEEPASPSGDVDTPSRNNNVDWSFLEAGPRDVFGLPFNLPSPLPDTTVAAAATTDMANRPLHPNLQGTVWPGDDEAGDERDKTNSEIALHELLETGYFDRTTDNEH